MLCFNRLLNNLSPKKAKKDYKQADNKKDKAGQVQSGLVYFPAHFCHCYNPET